MSQLDTPEPASSLSVDGYLSPEPSLATGMVIVKKGWLQGRCPTLGKANASLKRRFFVLEPTRVIWYDHDQSRSSSNLPSAPVGEMSLNPETHIFTDSLAKGQLCVQGFCRALVGEGGEALLPSALVHQAKGKLVLKSASPQEARDWASMIAAQVRLGLGLGRTLTLTLTLTLALALALALALTLTLALALALTLTLALALTLTLTQVDSQAASDAERTRRESIQQPSRSESQPPVVGASPRMPPQFTGWEHFSPRQSNGSSCTAAESPPAARLAHDRLAPVAEDSLPQHGRFAQHGRAPTEEPPRSTEDPRSPRAPHQAVHKAEPTPVAASDPGTAAHDAQHGALVPGATRASRRARESIWIKAREALEANTLPERPATSRDQAALGLGLG